MKLFVPIRTSEFDGRVKINNLILDPDFMDQWSHDQICFHLLLNRERHPSGRARMVIAGRWATTYSRIRSFISIGCFGRQVEFHGLLIARASCSHSFCPIDTIQILGPTPLCRKLVIPNPHDAVEPFQKHLFDLVIYFIRPLL
jgi:hypothetical protein